MIGKPAPEIENALPGAKRAFRRAILDWFRGCAEDYPWRRTTDPYAILVSEMMLQQTQVATVLGRRYFERWMEAFPDLQALATADEDAVLKAWEGLGYYSRARNLQKAARTIVSEYGGNFPDSLRQIESLPGIGRYTAGAVASFAFNVAAPVVDANVARVLARLFNFQEEIDAPGGREQLWDWAADLVSPRRAWEYNAGVMELGQKLCRARAPRCECCPVSRFCASPTPEVLPRKRPRTKTVVLDEHVFFANRDGRILLQQETGRRRKGLWKLPAAPDEAAPVIVKLAYSITHHRVTLYVHAIDGAADDGDRLADGRWFAPAEIAEIAMPSPYRKALEAALAVEVR